MRKSFVMVFSVLVCTLKVSAQNVDFTKVVRTEENKDAHFYRLVKQSLQNLYLGELNVDGFNPDDAETFRKIYKKAKEVGANLFALPVSLDAESATAFNPGHYTLELFYNEDLLKEQEYNVAYIFNTSDKTRTISWDGQKYELPSRTYIKKLLQPGKIHSLSTRRFLGTGIKLTSKEEQPAQYFQISGARIQSNSGKPGINFKSGDFIGLERSYGNFLSLIYTELP